MLVVHESGDGSAGGGRQRLAVGWPRSLDVLIEIGIPLSIADSLSTTVKETESSMRLSSEKRMGG